MIGTGGMHVEFRYEPRLLEYMKKSGKRTIVVELVEINNSDFEITELSVRFVDARLRKQFLNKRYRLHTTDAGEVLLPPFPLELEQTVTFGLKSILFFKWLTYSGIKV